MRKKQKNNHIANYVSIIILLLFFGCSIEKNHKMLTFFFDGVDKLNFVNDYLSKDSLNKEAILKRELALKKNRPDKFVHMPFKEKRCQECHTPDKHLQKQLPDLCYKCHKNFTENYKYVHGPVASGSCLKCHHQHYAAYEKLLVRPGQQVCTYCHSTALVFKSKYHRNIEDAKCTMCHSPHGSNNKYFLWDKIAKGFKGQAKIQELESSHLTGQIYTNAQGDVPEGTKVEIYNDDNVVVATVYTDSAGKFPLENMHPDVNYNFKFGTTGADVHLNILDYKNESVALVEKGRKGKYNFDKTAYENAHEALAKYEQAEISPSRTGLVMVNRAYDTTKVPNGKNSTDSVANIAKAKNATNLYRIDGKAVNGGVLDVYGEPTDTTNKSVAVSATIEPDTIIDLSKGKDPTALKLSGHTYKIAKGAVVIIVDDNGEFMAIGKVDLEGNFKMEKLPGDGNPLPLHDTSIFTNFVLLNYKTGAEAKFGKRGFIAQGGTDNNEGLSRVDKLRTKKNYLVDNLLVEVVFGKKKSELTFDGIDNLDKVIVFLHNNDDKVAAILNLSDTSQKDNIKQLLGARRAKEIANYLVSQGISKKRIQPIGFGNNKLLAPLGTGTTLSDAEIKNGAQILIKEK